MDDTLKAIFADVFGVTAAEYSDDLSPDTLTDWDSLGHIRLVSAMEDKLALTFETAEIMDMATVGAIKEILQRRGVAP